MKKRNDEYARADRFLKKAKNDFALAIAAAEQAGDRDAVMVLRRAAAIVTNS